MDLLNVVIKADTSGADRSSSALEEMSAAAARADRAVATVERRSRSTSSATEHLAASVQRAMQQLQALDRLNQQTGGADYINASQRSADIVAYGEELDRLRAKFNPVFAAQQAFDAHMGEMNRALQVGAISEQEFGNAALSAKAKLDAATASVGQHSAALTRSNAAVRGTAFETGNLAAQFQDIGVTAAMGMSPLMIALQQGTQISAVLGPMGAAGAVRGLGAAFLSIINPVSLVTIGLVALTAGAIQWLSSATKGAENAESALERHDKWLDKILEGYGSVGKAAKDAADEARRLPAESVASDIMAQQKVALRDYQAAIDKVGASMAKMTSDISWMDVLGGFRSTTQGLTELYFVLDNAGLSVRTTAEEFDALDVALTNIKNNSPNKEVAGTAGILLDLVRAADAERISLRELKDAGEEMSGATKWYESMAGVGDAIGRLRNQTIDLRSETEKLDAQFASDAAGARTMSELNALVAAYQEMQRAARASAWAIANSGEAAVVAASQYGTATGAANAYANAMYRLGSLIPQVAAQQEAMQKNATVTQDHAKALQSADDLIKKGSITWDDYAGKVAAANDRYAQAQDAISGVTAAEEELARTTAQNSIDALTGREQAIARVNQQYAEQEKRYRESSEKGATAAQVQALVTANSQQQAVALANVNDQFDRMASEKGAKGAGKALKEAQRDLESFRSAADKLGEKHFPAQAAQREAAELSAQLEKYRSQMDDFQIAGVEREIASLGSTAGDAAKEIQETLGKTLSSLFDGPIKDMDDFFGKLLGGFSSLGQENLSKFLDGALGGTGTAAAGTEGGGGGSWLSGFSDSVREGAEKGTQAGTKGGFHDLMKNIPGGAGTVSAGLGGLGIGYSTANPMMGALGGAIAGASMGPIGVAVGAIGGFIGGMIGANEELKKAKKALDDSRDAVKQFIATGLGDEIGKYETGMAQFNIEGKKFIDLAKAAKDSGTVKEIEAAMAAYKGTMGKQFGEELDRSIRGLSDLDYVNEAEEALKVYNQRLRDAAVLGVDAGRANTELALSLKNIVVDAELTDAQVKALGESFPELAGALAGLDDVVSSSVIKAAEERLKTAREDAEKLVETRQDELSKAYERQATAIKEVSDKLTASIKSLQAFKSELLFDTNLSPLDPTQRLMAAQSEFQSVSTAALGGDQGALDKLEDVSKRYLEEAKGYYATSEQYFSIFGEVNSTLDRALAQAQTQVSVADQQLAELKAQTSQYIDLNENVLSVADAIRALVTALDQQRGLAQPVGATGGDFRSSLTAELAAYGVPGYGSTVTPTAPVAMPVAAFQAPAKNDNANAEIVAELRAANTRLAALERAVGASGIAITEAANGTTAAVSRVEKQTSVASARR